MKFTDSLRFSAWREIHARWPVLLLFPLAMLLGLFLPTPWNDAWTGFVLFVLAPPLLVLLAAQGGEGPDRYWRGLGVSPLARWMVHAGLHLLPVLTLVLSFPQASRPFQPTWLALPIHVHYALAMAVLYLTTLAARALTGGFRVLAGPLLAALLVAPATWANVTFRLIPLEIGLAGRLLALGMLALVLTLIWERRQGSWGASLRRPFRSVLVTGLAFVLVTTGLEVGLRMPFPFFSHLAHVSTDGHLAAFISPWLFVDRGVQGRAWIWTDGDPATLPGGPTLWGRDLRLLEGVGYEDIGVDEGGVVATVRGLPGDGSVLDRRRVATKYEVVLTTPAGSAQCTVSNATFIADIQGGVVSLKHPSSDMGPVLSLSVSHGCMPEPPPAPARTEVQSQGHLWSVQSDETMLRKDGVPVEGLTRPVFFSSDRGAPGEQPLLREQPGPMSIVGDEQGVLVRVGSSQWSGPGGRRLYHITAHQTRVLDERLEEGGQGYLPWPEGPGYCRRRDERTLRCWDTSGLETLVERPRRESPEDPCWRWDQGQCTITASWFFPAHGDPVPLPEAPGGQVLLDPDHLRYLTATHVFDLGPEGTVSTHY